ncbi:hypothetical protein, partial [Streptomyces sp. MBT65]|uniref:hypothetical protein n=1 Tax=Streptomyces sp. MBT65 TaxID=1488395 RepID=UPI001F2F469F
MPSLHRPSRADSGCGAAIPSSGTKAGLRRRYGDGFTGGGGSASASVAAAVGFFRRVLDLLGNLRHLRDLGDLG